MAESNNLLKEKAKLLADIKRIQTEQGVEAAKLDGAYQKAISRLREIVKIIKASEVAQQKTADSVEELVSGAQSLSSVYKRISTQQEKQAVQTAEISNSLAARIDSNSRLSTQNATAQQQANSILQAYTDQASIARELAQLSGEDVEQKAALQSEFDLLGSMIQEELSSMDKRLAVTKDFLTQQDKIANSVQIQIRDAQNLSALTQEQKDILEQQAAVFDSMKKKVDALGSTLTTYLLRPQAAIGALVIGIGTFANKFGEVNRELGQSFLQGLNKSTMSATALGFIFDDTAGTVRELASEFGGVDAATLSTQANIGLMATNMGISNKEAVSLTASFARMNGGSTDIAADMVKTTQEFAHQNGIIPAALMQDLAGATEEFALFGKDGGENILRAAGYAQKLGVNMKTLSGIADNLLDFESSITKELELGAMLGKNINLDKARQLAYQGDIEGATKATLDQLGGIEAFNKMDYFQKKATADLLGVSVAELQKMADNQGKAATLGDTVNAKFSKMGEIINGGLNKWLGTGLQGLGGMITMTGQLGTGFQALGVNMADVAKSAGKGLKNLLMWPVKKIGGMFGGAGNKMVDKIKSKFSSGGIAEKAEKSTDAASKTPKKSDSGLKSLAKGLKAMGDGKVLFGALNLIPTALGFVAILPGLPGMLGVSLLGVGAGAGVAALGKGLKMMGNGKVLFGALNLIPTALGFAIMTLGVPGMIGVSLLGVAAGTGLTALGAGLTAMSGGLLGAATLAVAGLGFAAMTLGLIGMAGVAALGVPTSTGLISLAAGLTAMTAGIVGAAALLVAGLGFAAMTLGIPGMIAVSLLGIPASIGLSALAVGLTAFGVAAANPLLWLGIGAIGALGLALIPMAAALAIAAPAITAFGDVIGAAFGGVAAIITATSEGLTSMLNVITLEKAAAMLGLAGAFPLLAAGIATLGIAAFVGGGSVIKFLNGISESGTALAGGAANAIQTTASSMMSMANALTMINTELDKLSVEKLDALADFSMNVSVGNAVSAVGESISGLVDSVAGVFGGNEGGEGEDKNQLLIDELRGLRTDLNSGKIAVYMDGEKVTSRVSSAVERIGGNSYAMS